MDLASGMATHAGRNRPKRAGAVKMRLLITVMATLCPVVCYIGRQNLPMAIVSMVLEEPSAEEGAGLGASSSSLSGPAPMLDVDDDFGRLRSLTGTSETTFNVSAARQNSSQPEDAPEAEEVPSASASTGGMSKTYGPKYDWNQDKRGLLLGAFFYTYVIFQIPGARLAESMGPKWILATASVGTSLLNLISPWAASQHVYLFWLVRALMGACQAAIFPSCYVLYAKWLPPMERSLALPVLGVGAFVGGIVVTSLTGYFSVQEAFGWPWAFYLPGLLCALWSALWIWFATNEPREHRFISIEEIQHIELSNERQATSASLAACNSSARRNTISWRKLFTSRAIWVMMAAFFASNWSFSIVLLLTPSYLNNVQLVGPEENGMINSIIYVLFCLSTPLVGTVSTMMAETRACGLSRLATRKLFQCTALYGQTACLLALTWFGQEKRIVLAILFANIILYSLVNGGEVQLPAELSPEFSGSIYAIGNCVGSSTGFIVPQVYSLVVSDPRSRALWDLFFYLAALVAATGATLFLLFGQNQMQDFARDLAESELDFGRLGLTSSGAKGGTFNLVESHASRHKRSPGALVRPRPPLAPASASPAAVRRV